MTTADINGFLSDLTTAGVTIYDIKVLDELSINLCVKEQDIKKVMRIGAKHCNEIKSVSQIGLAFVLKQIFCRPVLLVGVLLWLLLVLYLPSRVLFVQVEGNETIPALLITEKAEKYGISFGSARKELRSEKIKNALLAEIPKLQWVGVNTRGCLAVISVRERSHTETKEDVFSVGHIVAAQDGVISGLTVTKGTPLCQAGDAVIKGQVLVSGYTDCGFVMRAEAAAAEVIAITEREITIRQPALCTIRHQIIDRKVDYSIQIGKNIVKLSKSAGIPNGNCAKIYEREYLTLPGGFRLPLALICERTIQYEDMVSTARFDEQEQISLAETHLCNQMLMGRILSSQYQQLAMEEYKGLKGIYICEEMIGKLRKEEIGK